MNLPMASAEALIENPPSAEAASDAPRTSNEVAGFEYRRLNLILGTLWLVSSSVIFLPFLPIIVARNTGDWGYARRYFSTLVKMLNVLRTSFRHGAVGRMFRYNIWMSPQAVAHRIAQRKGACTRCGKCCSQMECPFLAMGDEGRPVCTVYGTRFWYFGTCGRYPLTQQDIDDHACPGFSFMTEDGRLVYEV